jgi:hypothetical protein
MKYLRRINENNIDIKYREITDITDKEVIDLFDVLFDFNKEKDEGVSDIRREKDSVIVVIKMIWDNKLIEDDIEITNYSILSYDFSVEDIEHKYKQYLVAKGFHYLWKDNEFAK